MGNNQNPYGMKMTLSVGAEKLFENNFSGLKQRSSDWATVYPISGISRVLKAGEVVTLTMVPTQGVGMEPILQDNPDWPRSELKGYGKVALRFFVNGVPPKPEEGNLYTTMDINDAGMDGIEADVTFSQSFISKILTFPTELGVRMGSNQNPYGARLAIAVNDKPIFIHQFTGLKQRQSDWATVFPLKKFPKVNQGDKVTFSITPDQDTGIAALKINDPNCPSSPLKGYGNITARFYMTGKTAADETDYPTVPSDPNVFGDTMADGGSNYALGGGLSFTTTFNALTDGVPSELGIMMGNNQNTFGAKIHITLKGQPAFEKQFQNLKQRYSDWAVIFPLDGFKGTVKKGDTIAFTVTPDKEIGYGVALFNRSGYVMGDMPRYGQCRSRFFMHK
ncbi:MAG: hypothetical protein HQM08_26390 [Candidatus Riflebacteria bacterium]|nr:hypothetical protein [Candidatus Riflebacteria bacterium]